MQPIGPGRANTSMAGTGASPERGMEPPGCPTVDRRRCPMTKRVLAGTLALVLGLVAVATLASPAQAQAGTGTVSVVHGIPGVTVDVYVDDVLTLPNFTPGTVAGPLT